MILRQASCLIALAMLLCGSRGANAPHPRAETARWEAWSAEAFSRARSARKLVILDLEAVWCHWCHVMEETTYRDSEVVPLLDELSSR